MKGTGRFAWQLLSFGLLPWMAFRVVHAYFPGSELRGAYLYVVPMVAFALIRGDIWRSQHRPLDLHDRSLVIKALQNVGREEREVELWQAICLPAPQLTVKLLRWRDPPDDWVYTLLPSKAPVSDSAIVFAITRALVVREEKRRNAPRQQLKRTALHFLGMCLGSISILWIVPTYAAILIGKVLWFKLTRLEVSASEYEATLRLTRDLSGAIEYVSHGPSARNETRNKTQARLRTVAAEMGIGE